MTRDRFWTRGETATIVPPTAPRPAGFDFVPRRLVGVLAGRTECGAIGAVSP